MLESLALRRQVDSRRESHPRVFAYYRGRLSAAEGARLRPLLDRYGPSMFDIMERALDDMMAVAPGFGVETKGDVQAFLTQLHEQAGGLPHDEDFQSFEVVLERFYQQPIYPLLEHSMFLEPVGIERVSRVLALLGTEDFPRIADVAVGPAAVFSELLRALPVSQGQAFDISEPCVRYAKAVLHHNGLQGRASVEGADARSLPVPADSFELVVATEVIEHVPDPEVLIAELARILVPDGVLIASVPIQLPWGAHLAHFEKESEVRALFQPEFEIETFDVVPFGLDASLSFGRFRKRTRGQ